MVITFQAANTTGIVAEFAKNSDFPAMGVRVCNPQLQDGPF